MVQTNSYDYFSILNLQVAGLQELTNALSLKRFRTTKLIISKDNFKNEANLTNHNDLEKITTSKVKRIVTPKMKIIPKMKTFPKMKTIPKIDKDNFKNKDNVKNEDYLNMRRCVTPRYRIPYPFKMKTTSS